MPTFSLISFLGALAIFIYGIRLTRWGVQLLAGDQLRPLVTALTKNRLTAAFSGAVVTMIFQSSNATVIMLVSFAASGMITLAQAMGVVLGADIGSTVVIVILAFQEIFEVALVLLIIGVAIETFFHSKRAHYLGMVFLGFGFVFFGMKLLVQTTSSLGGNHLILEVFQALGQNPGYAFLGATLFTALVQNSATTLGLTMALSFSGLIDLETALPIVIGANVGTCAGSILASLNGNVPAKRVAFAHFFFKTVGGTLAFLLIIPYRNLVVIVEHTYPMTQTTAIALAHVVFNLSLSILFLPFLNQGAWLIQKLIPEPEAVPEKKFGPQYLNPKALETPALAFAQVKREILRMAEIAADVFERTILAFEKGDKNFVQFLEEEDDKIDILDRETKFFLAKISQENLTQSQGSQQVALLTMTTDLEEIGDIINKLILELANKKIRKGYVFSEEGLDEIINFHRKVLENFHLAIAAISSDDETIARKVLRHENELSNLEEEYRLSHLQRLQKGKKETFQTTSIHLDLLSNFRRINTKITALVSSNFASRGLLLKE